MTNYTPTYFRTYSPRVRTLVKDIETSDVLYDISDDIISLATNKAYGRCSGTWQMMLTRTSASWKSGYGDPLRFSEILKPNLMLTIEMDAGDGAGYFPVMCGLVDRVSEVRQGGTVPQRCVKVSGRDMGKLLEVHDVAFDIVAYNQQLAAQDGSTVSITRLSREFDPTASMGTPVDIINRVFELCLRDITGTQRIAFVSDCEDSFQIHQPQMMSTQGTSFWEYVKRVQHHPYNVLTTDTSLGCVDAFMLLLERTPINGITGRIERPENRWHTIGDAEIVASDIGVSDHERINFLSYQPAMYMDARIMSYDTAMVHPDLTHMDTEDVRQSGLCPHVIRDSFLPRDMTHANDANPGHQVNALSTAKRLSEMYWSWYRHNHTHESGTVTIHLRPDIRVGSGLLIKQPEGAQYEYKEYLVEQVAHSCIFHPQPQFVTTLHLTRGQEAAPRNADNAKPPQPAINTPAPTSSTITTTTNTYHTNDPATAAEARRLQDQVVKARQDALNKRLGR